MTQDGMKPIRRGVTGNDERGKSRVLWEGPAPNAHTTEIPGRGHTDFWVWNESPAPLSRESDDGNLPYDFPGPPKGGHWRATQAPARPEKGTKPRPPRMETKVRARTRRGAPPR